MKKWRIICWTYVRSKCLVFTPKERSISALSKVSSSTYEIEELLAVDQSQPDKQKISFIPVCYNCMDTCRSPISGTCHIVIRPQHSHIRWFYNAQCSGSKRSVVFIWTNQMVNIIASVTVT